MTDMVIYGARSTCPSGVPTGRGPITLILADVDEIMAILRRDPPAAETEPEAAA